MTEDRRKLIHAISHEFRSPLQGIMGYADFLLRGAAGPINSEMRECLRMIRGSAERFHGAIDNLVDLVDIEGDHVPLHPYPFSVKPFMEETSAVFQQQARECGVDFSLSVPEGIKAVGDPVRVHQVLANLFSNALKFTPAPGRISAGAELRPDHVEFFVQNTGPGVPPEQRDQIFEPFHQLKDRAPVRGTKGIGIGLSLCRLLVEAQEGRIWIDGVPAEGTLVRFTLPKPVP